MNQTGLIHLYHGDGKGKTTCAMGLALRCAGYNERVIIAQFLKSGTSGECRMLARIENVSVLAANPTGKFYKAMSSEEREQTDHAVQRTFQAATRLAVRDNARMLVLDEICAAIRWGAVTEAEVIKFLDNKPARLEIVLTGRDPVQSLVDRADYISEICKQKHPFDKGIGARTGVEK